MNIHIKYKINDLIFYIACSMLFMVEAIEDTSLIKSLKFMRSIICFLLLSKLICTCWTKRDLIVVVYLNLLGILSWIWSGDYTIFITIIVIMASKDIQIKKTLKISFWIYLTFFALHILGVIIGRLDTGLIYVLDDGIRKRYGLGYGHPNVAHSIVLTIIFLGLLAYKDSLKTYHYVLFIIFNLVMYHFTDSRTGMLLVCLGIIGAYIVHIISKFKLEKYIDVIVQNKIIKFLTSNIFILLTILSVVASIMYTKYGMFNNLGTLSSRFLTASRVIENNAITLFGQRNIKTDLGYIYILYRYGIVFWSIVLVAYSMLLRRMIESKLYTECIMIICFAAYSMVENFTGSILANITLIFMSFLIYPNNLAIYIKNNSSSGQTY